MTEGRLGKVGERVETTWGIVSRGGLLALVGGVLAVVGVQVARECLSDGLLLEPVVVKGQIGEGGPTPEMATQQIAIHIDKIQRSGAREWRRLSFAENEPTVSIQIPGSSMTLDGLAREIAELLPQRRRILKVSIVTSPSGAGYVAAVAVSRNGTQRRKTCEVDKQPGALNRMFECIAVEAMKSVDPLYAASYVLSIEEERCSRFERERLPPSNAVSEMQRLLQVLRDYCAFPRTRAIVASIVRRGNKADQPWVSYIYGKLHLARADAVAKFDSESQRDEIKRAIRRFGETSPDELPASARAILIEAYIKNDLSFQAGIEQLSRSAEADFIKHRLKTAAKGLSIAMERLEKPAQPRVKSPAAAVTKKPTLWEAVASGIEPAETADDARLASISSHMRGLLKYRKWVIDTRSRYQNGEFGFVEGPAERELMEKVLHYFGEADGRSRQTFEFYVEWGNAHRALGNFIDAIANYRRAGDLAPDSYIPFINVVVASLEKSKISRALDDQFDALLQASSYLTWVSEGGPFTTLLDRIAEALLLVNDNGAVDDSLVEDFAFCRGALSLYEADPGVSDMSHTAALKYCVDQARDSLARRMVREEIAREQKNKDPKPSVPPVETKLRELPGAAQKVSDQK
jgi:tetratricopeptide (TPR) repeat protein